MSVHFPTSPSIQPAGPEENMRIEGDLRDLAQNLPDRLPFPFSGQIAFQLGDGDIIQASHFPEQQAVPDGCPLNVLSVGKLFTAVAVMQLVDRGVLTLDTPLDKLLSPKEMDVQLREPYLEGKPDAANIELLKANAHRITVKDLLTHRSGLLAAGPEPEKFYEKLPSYVRPYSNYGYQLLAMIIGKHSPDGDKFDPEAGFKKHIEQKVFTPAKMQGAIHEMHDQTKYKGTEPDRYKVDTDGSRVKDETTESYPHGNGCWKMHAKDLLLFGQAIRSNPELAKTAKTMIESDPPI